MQKPFQMTSQVTWHLFNLFEIEDIIVSGLSNQPGSFLNFQK